MKYDHTIAIISLTPIVHDGRVQQQVSYLSAQYNVIIISIGPFPEAWYEHPHIRCVSVDPAVANPQHMKATTTAKSRQPLPAGGPQASKNQLSALPLSQRMRSLVPESLKAPVRLYYRLKGWIQQGAKKTFPPRATLELIVRRSLIGKVFPRVYESWYWSQYQEVFAQIVDCLCQAYHANDWEAVPLAVEAAKKNRARVVADIHEFSPLQFEDRKYRKLTHTPMITYFLKTYGAQVDASITVSPPLADRFGREFPFKPMVIMNVPAYEEVPLAEMDPQHIRLVHQGMAIRSRRLELLIETIALCEPRYTLHFILAPNHRGYPEKLQELGDKIAPGRVFFHPPVQPGVVVRTIASYDIGFMLIPPTSYSYLMSLPNKFFQSIVAGLAICIGPSPAMAEIVNQYGVGCVAPSFEPHDIARTLNALTIEDIQAMRQASREAAKVFNAKQEMGKVIRLYQNLFAERETR